MSDMASMRVNTVEEKVFGKILTATPRLAQSHAFSRLLPSLWQWSSSANIKLPLLKSNSEPPLPRHIPRPLSREDTTSLVPSRLPSPFLFFWPFLPLSYL